MTWPNFFIVGTSRAGTTSLYNYLNAINDVYLLPKGKIHYFFPEEFTKKNAKQEYLSLIQEIKNKKVIGEYAGYLDNPESPQLIKITIPEAKIIILIRDPIERAFSHYLGALRGKDETLSFEESFKKYMYPVDKETNFFKRYIGLGLYYEKVKKFVKVFGEDKVLIIIFEEFAKNPEKIFQKVLDFLGIDSKIPQIVGNTYNAYAEPLGNFGTNIVKNKIINNFAKKILPKSTRVGLLRLLTNKRGRKPELAFEHMKFLEEFYRNDSLKLEKLLSQKIPWKFIENNGDASD